MDIISTEEKKPDNVYLTEALRCMRAEIDDLDEQIMMLVKRRLEKSMQLGLIKGRLGLALRDPVREQEIIETCEECSYTSPRGVSDGLANVYRCLFREMVRLQKLVQCETKRS